MERLSSLPDLVDHTGSHSRDIFIHIRKLPRLRIANIPEADMELLDFYSDMLAKVYDNTPLPAQMLVSYLSSY